MKYHFIKGLVIVIGYLARGKSLEMIQLNGYSRI